MFIKYTGTADFKVYTAADFKKAGLDGAKKITFSRDEPTEVDDAVGELLTSKEGLLGPEFFEEVDEDELPEEEAAEEEHTDEDGETPWVERVDD